MEHGDDAVEALERAERNGIESETLASAPNIGFGIAWIWSDFSELSSTRSGGFGPSAITPEAVVALAEIRGYNKKERAILWHCVYRMDSVWLTWANKEKPNG